MAPSPFPLWRYYPANREPDQWVQQLVGVVAAARESIDTAFITTGLTSNTVLATLAPGLTGIGYEIELGKSSVQKLRRPVLFGDEGAARETYEVDGWHPEHGVVLEIEAGRGAAGNAVYRDLVRSSLILDAKFMALGLMTTYRFRSAARDMSIRSYQDGIKILDAIYASGRLILPFDGVLLFGY